MIEIIIKKRAREEYKETVNFETSKKPTDKRKAKEYGNGEEVLYETTSEPREIVKSREVERVLLTQQIEDDEKFDLAAVIKAINTI